MIKYYFLSASGLIGGSFLAIFEKFVFHDWEFAGFLFVLMCADTILGSYNAWQNNKFSSEGYKKNFSKTIVYAVLLILGHVLISIPVESMGKFTFSIIKYGLYVSIVINETISIITNCGKLGYAIPKWILQKLQDFNEKGEPLK